MLNAVESVEIFMPCNSKLFGRNINFNPCIVSIDDNRFLMSFHTFRRQYGHPCDIQPQARIYDPYHMWYGGPESDTWWNTGRNGDWGTGYMVIKIVNRNIFIHQVIDNTIGDGLDTRLASTPMGIVATCTQNNGFEYEDTWGINREKYGLQGPLCKVECVAIYYLILKIMYDKYNDCYSLQNADNRGEALCPKLQDMDKNWSLFVVNNKIYTSDYLTPKHTVITLDDPACTVIMEPNINVFSRIENYYKNTVKCRLSTPAINFNSYEMIAVGHVVLEGDRLPINTAAYNFNNQNILPKHPLNDMIYMMFFYTFDPNTFEILRVSPAFYPPNTTHGIVFASGLTFYDNDYIISYGEGDVKMKMLFIRPNEIEQLLLPQNVINDDYDFIYL